MLLLPGLAFSLALTRSAAESLLCVHEWAHKHVQERAEACPVAVRGRTDVPMSGAAPVTDLQALSRLASTACAVWGGSATGSVEQH